MRRDSCSQGRNLDKQATYQRAKRPPSTSPDGGCLIQVLPALRFGKNRLHHRLQLKNIFLLHLHSSGINMKIMNFCTYAGGGERHAMLEHLYSPPCLMSQLAYTQSGLHPKMTITPDLHRAWHKLPTLRHICIHVQETDDGMLCSMYKINPMIASPYQYGKKTTCERNPTQTSN